MTIEEIAQEFAEASLKREVDKLSESQLADPSLPERKEKHLKFMFEKGLEMASDFQDKRKTYLALLRGALRPDNLLWRKIFFRVTGVELPAGVSRTKEVVLAMVGSVADDVERERAQAEELKEAERRGKAEAERKAFLDKAVKAMSANEPIDGEQLVALAKHAGMELHPRTVGSFRRMISWIKEGQGAFSRKYKATQTAFKTFNEVKKIILERIPE